MMKYVVMDTSTIFKLLWKLIYDQLHDYLFRTRVEVHPVAHLTDTHLSFYVSWVSRTSGKLEISTFECPIDEHYVVNLLQLVHHLNHILLDAPKPKDDTPYSCL